MNCPNYSRVMTDPRAFGEGRIPQPVVPQQGTCAIPVVASGFGGQPQGRAVAPFATQGFPAVTAFPPASEPVGRPILGMPAPNSMYFTAQGPAKIEIPQRRSRRARALICAGLAAALLLGLGGGMTAFAHEDADSRMPIVQEYEEMVSSDASMLGPVKGDSDVVTILDDPTPMASSPTSSPDAEAFAVDAEPAPITDAAPAPIAGALEQTPAAPVPDPLAPYTLEINGTRVPYIHSVFAALCPDRNAALWAGSDDTTDGSYGYFIGHNPGDFACVYALVPGNYVTLCDANGNLRNYTVTKLYDVPNTTVFQEVLQQIIPSGESLVLQTCIGDGSYYRIVVCQ